MKKTNIFCISIAAFTIAINPLQAAENPCLENAPLQVQFIENWIHRAVERILEAGKKAENQFASSFKQEIRESRVFEIQASVKEEDEVVLQEETQVFVQEMESITSNSKTEDEEITTVFQPESAVPGYGTSVSMKNLLVFEREAELFERQDAIAMEAQKIYQALLNGKTEMEVDYRVLGIVPGTDLSLLPALKEACELAISPFTPARVAFKGKYGFELRRDVSIRLLEKAHLQFDGDGNITSCTLVFNPVKVEAVMAEENTIAQAEKQIDGFLAGIHSIMDSSMSEREAFQLISNKIAETFTYDLSMKGSTIAENLATGRAVCEGYAKALYLACNSIGIRCRYIEGEANGFHSWNQVCLDGSWFWSDLTWADQEGAGIIESWRLSEGLWADHIPADQAICKAIN